MTTREERNLQATQRWIELYNTDVHRMIDEMYRKTQVECPGLLAITDAATQHAVEQLVLDAAPDRRARIEHAVAKDDDVAVECVLHGTDGRTTEPWSTHWCAFLTFQDGLIVNDRTYLDVAAWPGSADVIALLASSPSAKPA
ncbi:nuclear transport factor 2 family protein [Streptomyces sp. NPDC055239]